MPRLPFYWVDVFASQRLGGNPCAVVLEADSLSGEAMQTIAREMNLSETAFVRAPDASGAFGARYFTPGRELPYAGHPTLAVAHALCETGHAGALLNLDLPAGRIPVEITGEPGRSRATLSAPAPELLRTYPPEVLTIFGLTPADALPGVPIQTVRSGTPVLMVPLASRAALDRARIIDVAAYRRLRESGDFLFPHHFILEGATPRGRTYARSLGEPPDGLEDPFTGSATGGMAAYLWEHGLLREPRFLAEQGHGLGRPGEAMVEIVGPRGGIRTVRVSGEVFTVVVGEIEV